MEIQTNKKLIYKAERNFPDFKVEYQLFERTVRRNKRTFDIKALKIPSKNSTCQYEESLVTNFEWRKNEAISIFEKTVEFSVTPMCLEDAILEFI